MTGWSGRGVVRDYALLLFLVFAYVSAVLYAAFLYGAPWAEVYPFIKSFAGVFPAGILFLMSVSVAVLCWNIMFRTRGISTSREKIRAAAALMAPVIRNYLTGDRPLAVFFSMAVTGSIIFFMAFKSLIRFIHPYDMDPLFAEIDRVLHGGVYPHRFVLPLVDAVRGGFVLDLAYLQWFTVMKIAMFYNIFFDHNRERRLKFLWVFWLSWIVLGSVCAVMMSSVGPVFYRHFYPDEPDIYFDMLQHFQQSAHYFSALGRDVLIMWNENGQVINANAISAMPSLHVAVAFVIALYAREIHRGLFYAAAVFCVMIMLGSVYFGFHYAIDGYFSMAAVGLMWWLAGRILREKPNKTA